jgi:hypothetical protein
MAKASTTKKAAPTTTGVDLLAQLGGSTKKKAKSDTPHISIADPTQVQQILAIIDSKEQFKEAESTLKVAEDAFRESAMGLYEDRCRDDATLHTSVRFVAQTNTSPNSLMFQQTRRCTKMPEAEAAPALQAIFGNQYYNLFEAKRTLNIKTESMTNDQITAVIGALQAALGPDFATFANNGDIFSENIIVAKEAFFGQRILNPTVQSMCKRAMDEGVVKLFSSSFKL